VRTGDISIANVEQWNDNFAREFDIDDYYTQASILVRWATRRRVHAIEKLAKGQPQHKILEVGCGGGHILRRFPNNQLVGTDVSGAMIQKSRRNLRGYDVTLHRGELHELELPKQGFDRIICSEVLEHVVNPGEFLAQIPTLLAPHGRVIITIPHDAWIDRIKAIIRGSGLHYIPPFRRITWGGDKYHLHAWTHTSIIADLSKHFQIERVLVTPTAWIPLSFAFSCTALEE